MYEAACRQTFKKMIAIEKERRRNEGLPSMNEIMAAMRLEENWIDDYPEEYHKEIKERLELIKNWSKD